MSNNPQRIIRLEVNDFLRVKTARITPDGKAVVVGGENGEGKSSLLLAIEALVGGKRHTPVEPVRNGAKKAVLLADLTDYVIEKVIKPNGEAEVVVRGKNGGVIPRPHELLSKLYDEMTFDPCAFDRMDAKERAAALRALVGIDFTLANKQHKELYDERTAVGREIKNLQGALATHPEVSDDTPDAEVSVAELLAEAERRQKVNAENASQRAKVKALKAEAIAVQENIAALERELAAQRERFDRLDNEGRELWAAVKDLADEDLGEVRAQVASAEETNAAARAKAARAKLQEELDAKIEESEALTEKMAAIDEQKAAAAAEAEYPVKGLTVTDDGVRLNDVPYEQASQAERLRASVAIGAAQKKGLRCMLIREGAFLDKKSMALLLGEIAREFDLQPFVEVVGDREECTVVMVDGEVAEPKKRTDGRQPAMGIDG